MRHIPTETKWRLYQQDIRRRSNQATAIKKLWRFSVRFVMLIGLITATVAGTVRLWDSLDFQRIQHILKTKEDTPPEPAESPRIFTKKDIRTLLDSSTLVNLEQQTFNLVDGRYHFEVTTTLNMPLQKYMLKKLERLDHISRGIPRLMSLVAIEPDTGKLLAMVTYDQETLESRPSAVHAFPAASIFKIVTATAAIESCGLTPSSILHYNGGKYTLYKRQLKELKNRYTQRISLKNAFAQSVNPIFGKLGAHYLGKTAIEKYANNFGFNSPIGFEVGLSPSVISLTDKPFNLAEIGCGFNRTTRISPLHGALLGSAILNNGMIMEPTIVEHIVDANGNTVYSGQPGILTQAMQATTSRQIKTLMQTTIRSGTGRKSFRGYRKDSILSQLTIGGKTGTICNKKHDIRYDWFVGFAEDGQENRKIAVAVVVGHQKYIGTRATRYARMAISRFFENQFTARQPDTLKKHRS